MMKGQRPPLNRRLSVWWAFVLGLGLGLALPYACGRVVVIEVRHVIKAPTTSTP